MFCLADKNSPLYALELSLKLDIVSQHMIPQCEEMYFSIFKLAGVKSIYFDPLFYEAK